MMSCVVKHPKRLLYCANFLTIKNRLINTINPYICFVTYASQTRCGVVESKRLLLRNSQIILILSRNKYDGRKKKHGKRYDEESSDEEDEDEVDDDFDEDDFVEKGAGTKTFTVKSMRIDSILKTVLGISRKNVEESFYQGKLRINGEMVYKKSQSVKLNDEIDIIKGVDDSSKDIVVVGRVKILKLQADPHGERILLKAWRNKSLQINNYEDRNAWRETTPEK